MGTPSLILAILLVGCSRDGLPDGTPPAPVDTGTPGPPPSAEAGWDALRYGGFVGAGVPADVWFDLVGADPRNLLEREGRAADLPASFNLFDAPNGVEVVGGLTCFGCHAGTIDGTFVPGLGNPRADFTREESSLFALLDAAIEARYGSGSPEAAAYAPFGRGFEAVSPHALGPFVGANPAFSLERAAAAHRDPETLAWQTEPRFDVPAVPMWCDTPPLWHADRKSRLYWTGFGTGQFERMLLQISVVAITDAEQADGLVDDFDDILAWMAELAPPPYPEPVDAALAEAGRAVFDAECAACHGTYPDGVLPEVFVPAAEVGTDPAYAESFVDSAFVAWVGESWFGEGATAPDTDVAGYVAPPLDGIWATAPYLHNGSVPDLASLLDPTQRPARWRRDPYDTSLDHVRLGWPHTVPALDEPADAWVYDTSVVGAGNGGHDYGAALTEAERAQVLEYLKTL